MNLESRIECIANMVSNDMDVAWDICCDHGLIGKSINSNIQKIIFLDQVSSIMNKLEVNYKATDIPCVEFKTESAVVTNFTSVPKTTFIICGIGGELGIKILENLYKYLTAEQEIILSVHKNIHKMRKYLALKNYGLVDEKLIIDNKKYYEILKLNKTGSTQVKEFGSLMWTSTNETIKADYIRQQIDFYKIKAKFDKTYMFHIEQLENIAR